MNNTDLFSGFDFENGLLKEPINVFKKKLEIFFPGDKYRILRYEIVDLFGVDENIYEKVDNNITIGKIFLLEIKIFKKHILDLLKDSDPEQQNILNRFLKLVNMNLTKVNSVLESEAEIPRIINSQLVGGRINLATDSVISMQNEPYELTKQNLAPNTNQKKNTSDFVIQQVKLQVEPEDNQKKNTSEDKQDVLEVKSQDEPQIKSQDVLLKLELVPKPEPTDNIIQVKKFIINEWSNAVEQIFQSENLEQSINQFIIRVFKANGFKLISSDTVQINQIVKSMCDNLEIIDQARLKLEVYNKKYISLGLNKSIKSIGSLRKTSVLLLTKTFLDKYLDMLLNVVNHKITMLEKIFGGNKLSNTKYLEYKIKYLLIKKFI